ncbi:MAG: hypothetical protein M3R68_05490 [Acidobacteriota bacterium]|nr:hypothetical protein [Acidobacteriota bacterium]
MNYPLDLSFKLLALANQISVTDAQGNLIFYVKQKMFKLKEAVTVFADKEQTRPLFKINADRVIDISARYHISDVNGGALGSVKRQGMKSLWRARYDICDAADTPVLTISEENPWVKVVDALVGEVPIVGMFTGFVFNPSYVVKNVHDAIIMRFKKQPSMFESKFRLESLIPISPEEEQRTVLSILMMVLLERRRG